MSGLVKLVASKLAHFRGVNLLLAQNEDAFLDELSPLMLEHGVPLNGSYYSDSFADDVREELGAARVCT